MLRKQRIKRTKKRRKKGEITKLKEKLWELCKQITRTRYRNPDGTWTCYTSGKILVFPKDVHTGHYITSSWCSVELRYDLKNLRIQSYDQNINKNGNTLQFRENLVRDHGEEYVEELWRRNKETKGAIYPQEWFECKIREYQQVLNTMIEKKHMGVSGDSEEYVKTPLVPVPDPLELAGYEKRIKEVDKDKPLA